MAAMARLAASVEMVAKARPAERVARVPLAPAVPMAVTGQTVLPVQIPVIMVRPATRLPPECMAATAEPVAKALLAALVEPAPMVATEAMAAKAATLQLMVPQAVMAR